MRLDEAAQYKITGHRSFFFHLKRSVLYEQGSTKAASHALFSTKTPAINVINRTKGLSEKLSSWRKECFFLIDTSSISVTGRIFSPLYNKHFYIFLLWADIYFILFIFICFIYLLFGFVAGSAFKWLSSKGEVA